MQKLAQLAVAGMIIAGATGCYHATIDTGRAPSGQVIEKNGEISILPETITAGGGHTCGLTSSGAAYCWGINTSGQLGDGTTTDRLTPVAVSGGHSFAQISAGGNNHTAAIATTGAAYAWGSNSIGQLGDGTQVDRSTPVAVLGGHSFAQISAGTIHTVAITTTGAAYAWGNNDWGQLGDGDTTGYTPLTPVAVLGGHSFAQISAGSSHTVAITATGAAYAWGENDAGQLGDGTTTQRLAPVAVAAGLTFRP